MFVKALGVVVQVLENDSDCLPDSGLGRTADVISHVRDSRHVGATRGSTSFVNGGISICFRPLGAIFQQFGAADTIVDLRA